MGEIENIKKRYAQRDNASNQQSLGAFYFSHYMQAERELVYAKFLRENYGNFLGEKKMLEIGAGNGANIHFFIREGFMPENIWANELLGNRFMLLKQSFPHINCLEGDASQLNFENHFDLIFQSTVFTSILDMDFKMKLARTMMKMLKSDGVVLWYDFKFDNPRNKDVKGISKREIKRLFPDASKIICKKVTLAPPIGRKVMNHYCLINKMFPFLRTHMVVSIFK